VTATPTRGAIRDAGGGGRAAVATLTWRGEETTRDCLESLRALPGWPADVLVVDNDSGTGEGERLASDFGVAAITTDHNGGVASGYNAAIRWALERGCSHVLLLNNDVRLPDPGVLERLLAAAGDGVAAVGPVVRDDDGVIWSAGGCLGRWTGRSWHRRSIAGAVPYEVEWIDGSAMLVAVAAARKIGGLAEDFFLYWEETDWCTRARRAGWDVRVQPAAQIVHVRGSTATPSQTYALSIRNMLLYARRHATPPELLTRTAWWCSAAVPLFGARVARTEGLRSAVAAVARVLDWHARDAARRGWRLPAEGPPIARS
jgi:GT2 family glycosyltransferase